MAAVAPAAPKQPPHSGRSPRPAKGAADFGRFLREASSDQQPAGETAGPAEQKTKAPAPEQNAPAAAAKPAADALADEQSPPAALVVVVAAEAEVGVEAEAKPDPAKAPQQAASTEAANPPIVPIMPLVPVMPAATAEEAAIAAKAAALPAAVPAAGAKPIETPAPPPAKALKGSAKGETPAATEGTKEKEAAALALEQAPTLAGAAAKDPEAKAAATAEAHHASANLLSFDELMRPDAKPEVAPEPMLDQLQQAMNSALLDENAQLVMPQVVRGLATLVTEGVSEMRLQLMPEDLGEIVLRVRTSEGVVRGEMMVQNPEVKHLLDQHLDRLRDALQQQGLDLRGFDIGLSPDGRFAQPDRSPHGAPAPGGTRRQAEGSAPETAAPVLTPRGAKEVDYLA